MIIKVINSNYKIYISLIILYQFLIIKTDIQF